MSLGSVIGTPRPRWYAGSVKALAFSPDGTLIAVGGYGEDIVVSEALTGREVSRHPTAAHGIGALAFSPNGRWIAWVSDGSIRFLGRDGSDAPRE